MRSQIVSALVGSSLSVSLLAVTHPARAQAAPSPASATTPGAEGTPAAPPSGTPIPPPAYNPSAAAAGQPVWNPPQAGAQVPVAPATEVPPPASGSTEDRLAHLEAEVAASKAFEKENAEKLSWLKKFRVTGYLQPQLLWQGFNQAASPNVTSSGSLPAGVSPNDVTAKPDSFGNNVTDNKDLFRLRRARIKFEFTPTDYARFVMEIDPIPSGGPIGGWGTIARNVEADGIIHWSDSVTTDVGAGIFKIPFGFEVLQTDADRPFIERSWGEQNVTPGEFDTGAKAYTTAKISGGGLSGKDGRLDFQVAVVNGETLSEKTFSVLPDLNKQKDVLARLHYDLGDWLDFGVTGYVGRGETVDPTAVKFQTFGRNAFNAELGIHHEWSKGFGTRLLGEMTFAQNMDRGVNYGVGIGLPALPATVGGAMRDMHERSTWARLEQDLGEWVTLGVRYDFYTPNVSVQNDGRDTFGAVAVIHFTKGLQWMNEFDYARDNVHVDGKPAPSKEIDFFSSVLQVRF